MTYQLSDEFDDLDGTLLTDHVSTTGQAWVESGLYGGNSQPATIANGLAASNGGQSMLLSTTGPDVADYGGYLQVDFSTGTGFAGIALRQHDTDGDLSGYLGVLGRQDGVGTYLLLSKAAQDGASIPLGGYFVIDSLSIGDVHLLGLYVVGDTVTLSYDNYVVATVTDDDPVSDPGQVGMILWGNPGVSRVFVVEGASLPTIPLPTQEPSPPVVTPAARTITVPAEDRLMTIHADDRTISVSN